MKRFFVNTFICSAAMFFMTAFTLLAQPASGDRNSSAAANIRFAYDVDFEMNFDNREYGRSSFSRSMTIFGARLSPSLGLAIDQSNGMEHRIMVGADIMKDFGSGSSDIDNSDNSLLKEVTLYYTLSQKIGKTDFSLAAGVFPRRFAKGEYSGAFFSDSLKFYDNNLEGLLLTFKRPNSYYEVGCDWMGMYGKVRRERFMIFSHGNSSLNSFVTVGWSAYMYHYAGSEAVWGVVDNILLNPFMDVSFAHLADFQKLYVSVGWLQSFQNDRRQVGRYVFPCGGELKAGIRKWNVGIENTFFYGSDMMPYYNSSDASGVKYGNDLYFGEPFYRVSERGGEVGFYDRLEVYYEPNISGYIDLRVGAVFHFNGGFSGWQQTVSLRFNLHELLKLFNHENQQN